MGEKFAGRYELVDPLGEGGSGVVWRAWDSRECDYVAAKVLRQVDAASLLRFIREQGLRIEHPHVLTPLGWAGEDEKVLLTLPIVRGGSVATLIGDFGPLPARLTAVQLDQVLAALEQIHALGVVHRDVKPANLLLDATGREMPHLWLSDFGVAAAVDEPRLTHGPLTLGTEGFAEIQGSSGQWTRTEVGGGQATDEAVVDGIRNLLRAVASGQELNAAASGLEAEHPGLAELLRVYGMGSRGPAVEHFSRHRDLF